MSREEHCGREVEVWARSGPKWAAMKVRAEEFVGVRSGRRSKGGGSRLGWLQRRGWWCERARPGWR
jgi:hypothetical protein